MTTTPRVHVSVVKESVAGGSPLSARERFVTPRVEISVKFDYGDADHALAGLAKAYDDAAAQIESTRREVV